MKASMPRRAWSPEDTLILQALYPDQKAERIAEVLGRSVSGVYGKADQLGLQKSAAFYADAASGRKNLTAGENTRFKPGHQTWNKGKSWDSGGRSHETRFKPGQKPHTWRPIGSERVTKEGYVQRKMTDTGYPPADWVAIHHLVWIEHHGPIPPKHRVVFRNRDKLDIRLENLELVSVAEVMRRNTIHRYPPELKSLIRLSAKIKRVIETQHEKQD